MNRPLAVAAMLLLACGSHLSLAQTVSVGEVDIENPWARASVPNANAGAAYMTLVVRGATPDRLTGLSTPIAERAEVHTHRMQDGMMEMVHLPELEVIPDTPARFEPGGLHVMLIGLKQPLMEGEHFSLTLQFGHSGTISVEVPVQSIGTFEYPKKED